MSDPRFEDRRIDPPYDTRRRGYEAYMGEGSGWILGAVATAMVVIGLLAFGMNDNPTNTAKGPMSQPETTGQVPRATPAPAPNVVPPAPPPASTNR